jgi:hypothetical protein
MKTETPTVNVSPRLSLRLAPALALALAALITCCPIQTRATPALSFTGGTAHSASGDITDGWAFSLSSATLVTDLGVWDSSNGTGIGDGLAESHLVTIWTGAGAQLVQATVPAGTGATLDDGFRYVSLTSALLLQPGNYVIGAYYSPASLDQTTFTATTVTTVPGVTITGSRLTGGNNFPSGDAGGNGGAPDSYFGPNFQLPGQSASVPDASSTWMLLLLGVTAAFGLKSFARRTA